jgi:hypothetical protein
MNGLTYADSMRRRPVGRLVLLLAAAVLLLAALAG